MIPPGGSRQAPGFGHQASGSGRHQFLWDRRSSDRWHASASCGTAGLQTGGMPLLPVEPPVFRPVACLFLLWDRRSSDRWHASSCCGTAGLQTGGSLGATAPAHPRHGATLQPVANRTTKPDVLSLPQTLQGPVRAVRRRLNPRKATPCRRVQPGVGRQHTLQTGTLPAVLTQRSRRTGPRSDW
jgi:hypothetical protein